MVDINLNNYEEFIIDYFDGNLSPAKTDLLMLFLKQHPDLLDEFDSYESNMLLPEETSFPLKNSLKKQPLLTNNHQSNFEQLCIAKLEGDLSPKEEDHFIGLLKQPENQKEFKLFNLVKLVPDESIVFKYKSKLKKSALAKNHVYSIISIAASIIIIIGLYFTIRNNADKDTPIIKEKISRVETENNKTQVKKVFVAEVAKKEREESKQKAEEININPEINPVELENIDAEKKQTVMPTEKMSLLSAQTFSFDVKKIEGKIIPVTTKDYILSTQTDEEKTISFKSYITANISKKLFNKKKDKIELFDIAQASIKGVNKIAGTKMSLERTYDINGNPEKTEFTSRLFAFSAPVKN